jgi:hypothetical protein
LKKLLTKPETLSFGDNEAQDTLDLARDGAKEDRGLLLFTNFPECYKKSEIDVTLALRSRPLGEEFHLVFCAIPHMVKWDAQETASTPHTRTCDLGDCDKGQKERVFVAVACAVQCDEEMISSVVRLEAAQERPNLLRYMGAPPFKLVFESGLSAGKWEVGIPGFGTITRESYSVDGMVQSCPEIIHGISGKEGQPLWDFTHQADFLNYVTDLFRVWLFKGFAGGHLKESSDLAIEFVNVFPSPCELEISAIEWIGHGPNPSSLRRQVAQLHMIPKAQPSLLPPTACQSRQRP